MLGRAAQEAATAAAAEPLAAVRSAAELPSAPRGLAADPPTRPNADPPTLPNAAEPPPAAPSAVAPEGTAPGARPPSDRAPAALPVDFGLGAGGHARVTPPQRLPLPLPRRSEPPPPAHVIVGGDASHSQSKPTPAPAINVMRIIAVGKPKPAPEVPEEEAPEETLADVEHDEDTPIVDRTDGTDISVDVVMEETELDDSELAPDSGEDKRPSGEVLELDGEDALSVPPEGPILADTLPDLAVPAAEARADIAPAAARPAEIPAVELPSGEGKQPPPPPLRKPQPPRRGDSSRPRPRRALKRPWWEDIFGEDFTRAVPRLSEKQVAREVDFIEESLGVAKGGVVLDLGCGAGHHAVDLAGRGYGVVGYDLSVYQLALAADVAQEQNQKINFLQGDMREMAFEAMFDGIYCWNTSFGYFEEDKNAAVAERVFRALKPGGMFLVDVANRDFAAMYSPSQLWYEGDSCVCMDDMSVDFITSRLRVKRSVIFDDGRSRECTYSIRLYSLHELGKLLHDVGFRVTEASGHPSTPGVFFGELSPRLIVLAQKP